MKIGVVGAGWVGVTTAVTLAHLGHEVQCSDIHEARVKKLQGGSLSFFEPGLEELMKEGLLNNRLFFTVSNKEVMQHAGVVFVCVDTPPKDDGSADLSQVAMVARDFAKWHLPRAVFVIKSTIPTGTCKKMTALIKEEATVARNTEFFTVAANPEFLAESTAVRDALNPSRIVLGVPDEATAERLKQVLTPLISQGSPLLVTDCLSAEIIKGASNAYLATRISFVNEVANYAVALGADPQEVARGMGLDPRIGRLRPGVGYGGGCFPKDVRSLLHEGLVAGTPLTILERVTKVNEEQRERLYGLLSEALGGVNEKRVAILGAAFKPNTDDIREAPAVFFVERLLTEGAKVTVYDPRAGQKMAQKFTQVILASSALSAITEADAVVLLTEWEEFMNLSLREMHHLMRGNVLVDGRGVWAQIAARQSGFVYLV